MFKYGLNSLYGETGRKEGAIGLQSKVVQNYEWINTFIVGEPPSKIEIKQDRQTDR